MIPKNYRLSRKDFLVVKKSGTKFTFPGGFGYYLPCPPKLPQERRMGRFSVVVSKQYSKSAVARNKFRRQIYNFLSTIPYNLSTDIIIFPFNEKATSGLNQALLGITTG